MDQINEIDFGFVDQMKHKFYQKASIHELLTDQMMAQGAQQYALRSFTFVDQSIL